jgi:hypothetical protein
MSNEDFEAEMDAQDRADAQSDRDSAFPGTIAELAELDPRMAEVLRRSKEGTT